MLGPCPNKFRQRITIVVPFAQEYSLFPIANCCKSVITDKYPMQAINLGLIERPSASFENGASPPFNLVTRRSFAFFFKELVAET